MTKTASRAALLHVAAQDLRAGKRLLAERLPALADAATDADLARLIGDGATLAERQRDRIDAAGDLADGPDNLWMAGILDDADRDARSHQPGVLLDVALIGAVRKAKAAEIVSHETAVALARGEDAALGTLFVALREEDSAADRALRGRLDALTG